MKMTAYLERFEHLSLREKVLIAATVSAFLVSLLQFFLVDPALAQREVLQGQLNNLANSNQRLQMQLDGKLLMPKQNRQLLLEKELAGLRQALQLEAGEIRRETRSLVASEQMPALLQRLVSERGIELVALHNIAPAPLLENSGASSEVRAVQLYEHGIELELKGTYHALRRYLLAVEGQPWRILWDAVHLKSKPDGESVMRLQVKTLSTEDVWLGV
jgi:MSHA biogenesis protein MshJ